MTQDEFDDARYEAIEAFSDKIFLNIDIAISKAGGDYDAFLDYICAKEGIELIDEALVQAFEGVEEIKYKGVL